MKHHHRSHRFLVPIGLGIYLIILGLLVWNRYQLFTSPADSQTPPVQPIVKTSPPPTQPVTPTNLPAEFFLQVPFTVQAPIGVWDATHEEACEEASLLMVEHYKTGLAFSSPVTTESEIQSLINWETSRGYKVDLTAAELKKIATDRFSLSSRVIDNPTVADIKTAIASGHLVVVPAAGQVLGNPHFTAPGPVYHMLVIIGYDPTDFITNDPGTRYGQNYHYPYSQLTNAIHDWDPADILSGLPRVVVFD